MKKQKTDRTSPSERKEKNESPSFYYYPGRKARHRRVHEYFYGPHSWASRQRQRQRQQQHLLSADEDAASSSEHAATASAEPDILSLAPSTLELHFRDVEIVRVLALDAVAVDSMLPVGQGSMLEPLQVVAVTPSPALIHNVLAVCHSPDDGDHDENQPDAKRKNSSNPRQFLLNCAVAGFVVVSAVNMEKGTLTLLAPCSGDLPTKHLVLGKIEWMESTI